MFYSSRNAKLSLSASEALLKGISEDGGLFLPKAIVRIPVESLQNKTYPELAFALLQPYFDDFSEAELRGAIENAYSPSSFPEKIFGVETKGNHSFLELFHGGRMRSDCSGNQFSRRQDAFADHRESELLDDPVGFAFKAA